MIKKLRSVFKKQDEKAFLLLVIFSIFISLVEVIGISAIMPFISISMDFNTIHSNEYYTYFFNFFSFSNDIHFVVAFGIILVLFYIFRSIINIYYAYLMAKFSHEHYHYLVSRLFKKYLGMTYKSFVKKNSSNLTKTIVSEASNLTRLITSVLFIISELLIIVLIYSMMLYVDYQVTLLLTVFLLINAYLMIKTISKKIKKQGDSRVKVHQSFFENINKNFGNFKILKLYNNDETILNEFESISYKYSKINSLTQTLLSVPRLILEAIAFCLIIFIILYLVLKYGNDISTAISMLSMFILALYRLMPSVNRVLTNYNNMLFYIKSLEIIHTDLMSYSELLGDEVIFFNKKITIQNMDFSYEKNKQILKNINLCIQKGDKVAFIGNSGSGKSTLVDIIMGLHTNINGNIFIDDMPLSNKNVKSWRSKIGYIPQSVYLFDGTVGENIVFNNLFNEKKVIKCLKQAKIYDFLQTKEGLNTMVGEGGIMLSGGQRQRIAIARALYIDPDILVLDEATSALDTETEAKIMDEIYNISENKTLIVIAHRLSTIQRCNKIYELEDGGIII